MIPPIRAHLWPSRNSTGRRSYAGQARCELCSTTASPRSECWRRNDNSASFSAQVGACYVTRRRGQGSSNRGNAEHELEKNWGWSWPIERCNSGIRLHWLRKTMKIPVPWLKFETGASWMPVRHFTSTSTISRNYMPCRFLRETRSSARYCKPLWSTSGKATVMFLFESDVSTWEKSYHCVISSENRPQ